MTLQLLATGQVDPSFGAGGGITTTTPTLTTTSRVPYTTVHLALTTDGSVYAIARPAYGSYGTEFVRVTADGQRDDAFSTNFLTSTLFLHETNDSLDDALVFDSHGRFYLSARYSDGAQTQQRLIRFNSNGTVDATNPVSDTTGELGIAGQRLLRSSGKLLVVSGGGSRYAGGPLTLWRFLEDGSLDTTFGNSGQSTILHNATPGPELIAQAGDAMPLVDMYCDGTDRYGCASTHVHLVRVRADGTIDPAFGTNGDITLKFDQQVFGPTSTDQIIIEDNNSYSTPGTMAFTRLMLNGAIDSSYGVSGTVTMTVRNPLWFVCASVQADDALVVAYGEPDGAGLILRRIDPGGHTDAAFGYLSSLQIFGTLYGPRVNSAGRRLGPVERT